MPCILIADDEPDVLESTRMVLEMIGYDVVTVGSASNIVSAVSEHRPDILLQDVMMPGLNLAKTIALIRGLKDVAPPRILIFTASAEGEEVYRQVGADGYIRKPFDGGHIQETLRRLAAPAASSRGGGAA